MKYYYQYMILSNIYIFLFIFKNMDRIKIVTWIISQGWDELVIMKYRAWVKWISNNRKRKVIVFVWTWYKSYVMAIEMICFTLAVFFFVSVKHAFTEKSRENQSKIFFCKKLNSLLHFHCTMSYKCLFISISIILLLKNSYFIL